MRRLTTLFAGLLMLGLAACAGQIKSDVARFHKLPPPQGETVAIVPADPAKRGSLEFATYANMIGAELGKLGYKPAAEGATADLEVVVDYSVSEGTEKLDTRPGTASISPYYYNWRSRAFYPYYGPYDPFWGPGLWNEPEVYSYTVYTRKLSMKILKGDASKEMLFEGRVDSIGRDNRLPEVMPYLVQALFTDFPGQSGVTKRVKIDLPQ
ncbi:DUF4136 domain-containing protein [Parapedomonas caeni]